jgi:hypothetical protein
MRAWRVSSSPPDGMVVSGMACAGAPLYFTKGRSDHHVHPIRAVIAINTDHSPRRHAARVFRTRGGCR